MVEVRDFILKSETEKINEADLKLAQDTHPSSE